MYIIVHCCTGMNKDVWKKALLHRIPQAWKIHQVQKDWIPQEVLLMLPLLALSTMTRAGLGLGTNLYSQHKQR